VYVCPLCDSGFVRKAVETGYLTAEHVPPKSLGGRELLLTCRPCNNAAGVQVDSHARSRENVFGAISGDLDKHLKVSLKHGGRTIRGRLRHSAGAWDLRVVERANDPADVAAFRSAGLKAGSPLNVTFDGDRYSELGAKMSWFRSGYLALFAAYGYRFSFDPAIEIVKRQLRSPETRVIYCFTIVTYEARDQRQWRILNIPVPACTGVLFGRYVLLYPNRGDVGFYQRLEADILAQGSAPSAARVTAQSLELADGEPLFGFPIEDSSDSGGASPPA